MLVHSVSELGALVRDRRNQLGWSQSRLASKIGVQRLWVSQFEAGKTTVHIGLVMRALRALELEMQIAEMPPPKSRSADTRQINLDTLLEEKPHRIVE